MLKPKCSQVDGDEIRILEDIPSDTIAAIRQGEDGVHLGGTAKVGIDPDATDGFVWDGSGAGRRGSGRK